MYSMNLFTKENRGRISRRLKSRLGIFAVITVLLAGFVAYDIATGAAAAWMLGLALVIGLPLGYVFGRLTRVVWHEGEEKVVQQMDVLGFVLIGLYVLVAVLRNVILRDLVSGATLTAVSLALATGLLIGRFGGLYISIRRALGDR